MIKVKRVPKMPLRSDRSERVRGSAFDLRKRGAARFDLRDPYFLAVTLSWPAFIGCAFGVVFLINALFALLYVAQPGAVQNLPKGDVVQAFFFSVETLATVGYGEMAPATFYGHAIAAIEIIGGMAFTAILTGLLFVRFSKPQARIVFAKSAVIAMHNDQPTLMIRLANGRLTMLTGASAKLGVLLHEQSTEGQSFRRIHDVALLRETLPIFPLTWTLMHTIDAQSPFHGHNADSLANAEVRLFLAVEARDAALGAQLHADHDYDADRILFGMRYADAVTRGEDGSTTADLGRISAVEVDGGATGGSALI